MGCCVGHFNRRPDYQGHILRINFQLALKVLTALERNSQLTSNNGLQIVYRQGQLGFRPPLEEVKAKYYREMKKFLCIPNHFKGLDAPIRLHHRFLIHFSKSQKLSRRIHFWLDFIVTGI